MVVLCSGFRSSLTQLFLNVAQSKVISILVIFILDNTLTLSMLG